MTERAQIARQTQELRILTIRSITASPGYIRSPRVKRQNFLGPICNWLPGKNTGKQGIPTFKVNFLRTKP